MIHFTVQNRNAGRTLVASVLAVSAALMCCAVPRAHAQAGRLDTHFGQAGTVTAFAMARYDFESELDMATNAAASFAGVPVPNSKIDCRTLLSAKELAGIAHLAAVQDPVQISGDDPSSPIAKGVTTCTYGAGGWIVKFSVYGGPSVSSVFESVWKNQKGTKLSGIGDGAYFDPSGLNNGVARSKGFGLTLQFLSGFMTKEPPPATMQSWTEQILKLVIGRL
jgi:hypothetical protein